MIFVLFSYIFFIELSLVSVSFQSGVAHFRLGLVGCKLSASCGSNLGFSPIWVYMENLPGDPTTSTSSFRHRAAAAQFQASHLISMVNPSHATEKPNFCCLYF